MIRAGCLLTVLAALLHPALGEPALRLEVTGAPASAVLDARPGCDADDIPDAPARAVRTAKGETLLFASHFRNRLEAGTDLRHLRHRCKIVMTGGNNDDPAAYDDRAWIASPWTFDGVTIFAVVHNEFHGHRRPTLCPSGRYMDCWFNALTAAVSHDGGETFHRMPSPALVAALPYRYDEVGRGHHGYFNPSNIVSFRHDLHMLAFTTRAGAQRAGNCLLRTATIVRPDSWRAWNGVAFSARFVNPWLEDVPPEAHVCAPVAPDVLRWPVTSLTRHRPSGQFIALMQNGTTGGGIHYATSPDLLTWSGPSRLMPATGPGVWASGDPAPVAYPSLLDPGSPGRNFEFINGEAMLFVTRFNVRHDRIGMDRELIYWNTKVIAP